MDTSESLTSEELAQENTEPALHYPTVTPQYYTIMDDEGPDEVFIQPPFLSSRMEPEGGSTCEAAASYTSVSPRSSDATAAKDNPECLDGHHGERQLMTSHSQVNEEMERTATTSEEVVRRNSSGGTQCTGQDLKLMEDSAIPGNDEKEEEKTEDDKPEDQVVELKTLVEADPVDKTGLTDACLVSQDLKNVTEDNQCKIDATAKLTLDNSEEEGMDSKLVDVSPLDSGLSGYDWVKRTGVEDVEEAVSIQNRQLDAQEEEANETIKDSRIASEILQGEDLLQRLQQVQLRQDLAEICQLDSKMEDDLKQNVARDDPEIIQEVQKREEKDKEPKAETSVLIVTEQFEHCRILKTEVVSCSEKCDTRNSVNLTDSSSDEEVCGHLEDNPEKEASAEQNVVVDKPTKHSGLDDGCPKDERAVEEKLNCAEENHSENEDENQDTKERTSLSPLSPQKTDKKESGIEETETWVNENRIPFLPCHRFSATETDMEKQFQAESQKKQDLQRAEGVFDLSGNPDVLEIPFKTNISLEPLPSRDDPGQEGEWPFSEQKMQKEISQEMQRELVLVNLGKIPGGYSKGESRQIKDTKQLFEAFQQDKPEGPTRIRKPQTSLLKNQVYPSVLERTRSLEMFSNKTSPMLRTHSFRLVSSSDKEKHSEVFRSQSPSLRDKARLSPYPTHEKLPRKHKSMDSINILSSTKSTDRVRKTKEEQDREGSPLLKENPFFKLRPALSLQPEVEKDIREAKKREEELRKQRSSLYGETRQVNKEEGKSTAQLKTESKQKTTGRLERVWPPPSKKDTAKAEQEARVQRAPGHRAALWQRWESGLINGQTPSSNNN